MNIKDAILKRHSVRSFLKQDVPLEYIMDIIDTAKYAPSGTNTQPWVVAVVMNDKKRELDDALLTAFKNGTPKKPDYNYYPLKFNDDFQKRRIECGLAMYGALNIDKQDKNARLNQWAKNYTSFDAPVTLYIFADKSIERGSYMDCGMFIQSIMLMAIHYNLATCPQAALAEYPDIVRSHLGYSDENILLCGIAVGYENTTDVINKYRTSRIDVANFTKIFK